MRHQADYLLATGFVAERLMEQHAVETYSLPQLDRLHRLETVEVNSKGFAYTLLGNRQSETLATTNLDAISNQWQLSPQRTSSSVVTNHTLNSCKSTRSALKSSSLNGNTTDHQTPVSDLNKRSVNNMDEKNENLVKQVTATAVNSVCKQVNKNTDPKISRRLAQNRQAAKKSRMRKKAYVQQLEASHAKLNQVEQELGKVRQQVIGLKGLGSIVYNGLLDTGAATLDLEYAHWLDEKHRLSTDLRAEGFRRILMSVTYKLFWKTSCLTLIKFSSSKVKLLKETCFIFYPGYGRLQQKDVSCGWEGFVLLKF